MSEHEYSKRTTRQEIFIPVAESPGNEAIEFKNVSKALAIASLIDNLSFKIPPGAIAGNHRIQTARVESILVQHDMLPEITRRR